MRKEKKKKKDKPRAAEAGFAYSRQKPTCLFPGLQLGGVRRRVNGKLIDAQMGKGREKDLSEWAGIFPLGSGLGGGNVVLRSADNLLYVGRGEGRIAAARGGEPKGFALFFFPF